MKSVDELLIQSIECLDVVAVGAALKGGADVHGYHRHRSTIGYCLDATYPWPNLFDPRVGWIVRLLVEAGAEPDQPVDEGHEGTALHEVAMHGPYGVIETLLDVGADPNLLREGETALDIGEFDYWYHSMEGRGGHNCTILARADLPVLSAPDDDVEYEGAFDCWIRWSQQQFIPLLRRRGARRRSALEPRAIADGLWVDADIWGGLATRSGIVEDSMWQQLEAATRDAMRDWCATYVNPWIEGFDGAKVAQFDYDGHAHAGLELARHVVTELEPDVPVYFIALSRAALNRRSHETKLLQWAPLHGEFVAWPA